MVLTAVMTMSILMQHFNSGGKLFQIWDVLVKMNRGVDFRKLSMARQATIP